MTKELLRESSFPWQNPQEWTIFLSIVENHIKGLPDPVVVELGVFENKQKSFYKDLGLTHFGIDANPDSGADLIGDTHQIETMHKLYSWLGGRHIDILFIDADHSYSGVRQDYIMYGSITRGIVAFHDIYNWKYGVKVFWNELVSSDDANLRDKTFVTINAKEGYANHGIGLVVDCLGDSKRQR